jgi:predicted RNA-binding Zn-ribbon protein involved in translation (DUF1610 family)
MPSDVCVKCGVFLRPKTNGVGVLLMADFGPYQLWLADVVECPECGCQVIRGYGQHRIAEHYEGESFERLVESYRERNLLYEVR